MRRRSFDSDASSGSSVELDPRAPAAHYSHHQQHGNGNMPGYRGSGSGSSSSTPLGSPDFSQFFGNTEFADVSFTFPSEGSGSNARGLPGHKAIIAAICPKLRPALAACGAEFEVKNYSQPVFEELLRSMYTNRLPELVIVQKPKPLLFLLDLLGAAVDLALLPLENYLVECLLHRINNATVAVILIRAEQLACADLKALCREFLLTLEVEDLTSVFRENLELAREEADDASALLSAETVAEVMFSSPALKVPLVEALHLGRTDVVGRLLMLKANPKTPSPDGKLPLQIALEAGQDEMVETIIRAAGKQILNARASDSSDPLDTLLHVAVRANNTAHCRLLLMGGADAWEVNSAGQSPLHLASSLASVSMVRLLLQYPTVVNQQDENGETCLHMVGQMRDQRRRLRDAPDGSSNNLLSAGDSIDARDHATLAVAKEARGRKMNDDLIANSEIVTKLLLGIPVPDEAAPLTPGLGDQFTAGLKAARPTTKFADPEIPCKYGRTPLHTAALHGAFTVVNVLLSYGKRVDITARDYSGNTPLHCAALGASLPCMSLLTQRGASTICLEQPSVRRRRRGKSANHHGSGDGHAAVNTDDDEPQMVAFIDATNHSGDTALHLAAVACLTSVVKMLLEAGAKPNVKNAVGYTPLHVWCDQPRVHNEALSDARGESDLQAQVLSLGVLSLDGVDGKQYTALQAFLDKKAQVNMRTKRGATPLHLAMARGHQEMVVELLKNGANLCAFDFGGVGGQPYTPLTQLRANDSNHHRRATQAGAERFVMNSPQLTGGMALPAAHDIGSNTSAISAASSSAGTPQRGLTAEPRWTHCVVFQDLVVREGASFESKLVGRRLPVGESVIVAETRGRRARLVSPVHGWASLERADGKVLLRPLQDTDGMDASSPPTGGSRIVNMHRNVLDQSTLPSAAVCAPLPPLSPAERLALERTALNSISHAPEWMPDNAASNCHLCARTYSNFQRRHHCRHCGHIICKSCSPNRDPIPKFGITDKVRVCNRCHHVLTRPFDEFPLQEEKLEYEPRQVEEAARRSARAAAHNHGIGRGRVQHEASASFASGGMNETKMFGSPSGSKHASPNASPGGDSRGRSRRNGGDDWAAAELASGAIVRQRSANELFDKAGNPRASVVVSKSSSIDSSPSKSSGSNPFDVDGNPFGDDSMDVPHNPHLLAHPDDPRASAFAQMDDDGDGVISREEFARATAVKHVVTVNSEYQQQQQPLAGTLEGRSAGAGNGANDFAEAAQAPQSPSPSGSSKSHRRKSSKRSEKRSKRDKDSKRRSTRRVARFGD